MKNLPDTLDSPKEEVQANPNPNPASPAKSNSTSNYQNAKISSFYEREE